MINTLIKIDQVFYSRCVQQTGQVFILLFYTGKNYVADKNQQV